MFLITLPDSIFRNASHSPVNVNLGKFSVGDSVLLNTKLNKVEKILPLKKGAKIEVVKGKHAGEKGELVDFVTLSRGKDYVIKLKNGKVSLPYKTILVIE